MNRLHVYGNVLSVFNAHRLYTYTHARIQSPCLLFLCTFSVPFHSLRRAARFVLSEAVVILTQLRDRQKANNNTFMWSPSRSSIHLLALVLSLSLIHSLTHSAIARCVHVCARLSLVPSYTVRLAYASISMYVCVFFSILFFLERIPTFPSQDEVGYAYLFRACNDLFYFDNRKL